MMGPMFDQTVTRYRRTGDAVERLVLEGCYYFWHDQEVCEDGICRRLRRCLLVVPGAWQTLPEGSIDGSELLLPGDRVCSGIGAEVTPEQWPQLLPTLVPTLSQIGWVKPMYLHGRLHQLEAGSER